MSKSKKSDVVTLQKTHFTLFIIAFALVGTLAVWSVFAYPQLGKGKYELATCNLPAQIKQGSYYTGTIVGIPDVPVINIFMTFGDGSELAWPMQGGGGGTMDLQYLGISGKWDGTGSVADILGTTTIKVTGPTKNNPKTTNVYALCSVEVVAAN